MSKVTKEQKEQQALQQAMFEEQRQIVVQQELEARSWKAHYEKMYYALESDKLEPLFAEYKKRKAEERQANLEKIQAQIDKANEEAKAKVETEVVEEPVLSAEHDVEAQ
jgi:hypothetical protein